MIRDSLSVRVKSMLQKPKPGLAQMELTEQIAMVLVVFALLGGLLWLLKKRGMASLRLRAPRGAGAAAWKCWSASHLLRIMPST